MAASEARVAGGSRTRGRRQGLRPVAAAAKAAGRNGVKRATAKSSSHRPAKRQAQHTCTECGQEIRPGQAIYKGCFATMHDVCGKRKQASEYFLSHTCGDKGAVAKLRSMRGSSQREYRGLMSQLGGSGRLTTSARNMLTESFCTATRENAFKAEGGYIFLSKKEFVDKKVALGI